MRFAATLAIVLAACVVAASAQTSNPSPARASVQNVSLAAGQSAVTGCLKGSTNQFYLMEQNGTLHLLMGPNKELQAHVGYWVELGGNRDSSRDASASSDEGTAHGMRFFQVEEVLADQGSCQR